MRRVILVAVLCLPVAAQTRKPIRVAVSSTSTVPTSDLQRGFEKKCPNVILNHDPARADFALEAIGRTAPAGELSRYRFTLFNRAGNAVYSTSPHKFSNAINNICAALKSKDAEMTKP
jgi:hypothetical protein